MRRNICLSTFVLFAIGFVVGCSQEPQKKVVQLADFVVTNRLAGGSLTQTIALTNGLSLYFSRSNVIIWFREGNSVQVTYEEETLTPSIVIWGIPASDTKPKHYIYDYNADGIADGGRINGTNQVFFEGEFYNKDRKGTNIVITVNGEEITLYWDTMWRRAGQ
ncbi:MAG TPA: hypothetical protein VN673_00195 [Clostridia bacterium]|nr:hypothetical protein [Clostridia bacterium]